MADVQSDSNSNSNINTTDNSGLVEESFEPSTSRSPMNSADDVAISQIATDARLPPPSSSLKKPPPSPPPALPPPAAAAVAVAAAEAPSPDVAVPNRPKNTTILTEKIYQPHPPQDPYQCIHRP